MYKIEQADLSDYRALCGIATESGKPDYQMLDGAILSRLVIDGQLVALAGYKDMEFDGAEYRVLACLFRRDIGKFTKTFVRAGREYLRTIKGKPIVALAVKNNETFNRFIQFMGFKSAKCIEKDEESGIIYNIYVRK